MKVVVLALLSVFYLSTNAFASYGSAYNAVYFEHIPSRTCADFDHNGQSRHGITYQQWVDLKVACYGQQFGQKFRQQNSAVYGSQRYRDVTEDVGETYTFSQSCLNSGGAMIQTEGADGVLSQECTCDEGDRFDTSSNTCVSQTENEEDENEGISEEEEEIALDLALEERSFQALCQSSEGEFSATRTGVSCDCSVIGKRWEQDRGCVDPGNSVGEREGENQSDDTDDAADAYAAANPDLLGDFQLSLTPYSSPLILSYGRGYEDIYETDEFEFTPIITPYGFGVFE